jgi:hypothetical protein
MKLFSQRNNLSPVRVEIQKDSMDDKLRNKLWTAFYEHFGRRVDTGYSIHSTSDKEALKLYKSLFIHFFDRPIDELPGNGRSCLQFFREPFMKFSWYTVYDFCEAVILYTHRSSIAKSNFIATCNTYLEQELSAYRIVAGKVTEITSETEISAIQDAISTSPDHVQDHLRQALALFSDRENPDYRNSIKESISAVEAICKQITGKPKATLGDALKEITKNQIVEIHPALAEAFNKKYGWTSDGGIRHGMMDISNLGAEDARYMLVSCSSFINYLTVKADKAGIKLHS